MKLVKGDKVLIIAGRDRGKTGNISRVWPKKDLVLVSGASSLKKHLKRSTQNPQGGIVELPRPIHVSNVMLLDSNSGRPTRIGYRKIADKNTRIALTSNQPVINKSES